MSSSAGAKFRELASDRTMMMFSSLKWSAPPEPITAPALILAVALLSGLLSCSSGSDLSSSPAVSHGEVSTTSEVFARELALASTNDGTGATVGPTSTIDSTSKTGSVVPDSTSTTTSTRAPERPEITVMLDELLPFVEQERGLTFLSRPIVHVLDGPAFSSAFAKVVSDAADEEAQDWQNFTDIYQAVGILGSDTTLEQAWLSFGDAGVLGYHENETGELTLRAGEITQLTKVVLVHELTHALDHQHFGLDRPDYDDDPTEVGWTFSAIVEGSASAIENRYWATLTGDQVQEARDARRALGSGAFDQPASFLELQFGRYREGVEYVDALWQQGQTAVDRALISPPATSEVVYELDFAAEFSRPALTTPADGDIIEQGIWGQAAWYALFLDQLSKADAAEAARGWGSDWFVAWRDGDSTCVRIYVEADTPADLDQFAEAAQRWAGATDSVVSSPNPSTVGVTSCG